MTRKHCWPVFLCARYHGALARCQGTLARYQVNPARYQGTLARCQGTLATASTRPWQDIPGPPAFPVIGNLHLFVKKENSSLSKLYRNLKKKYGPVYKTRMFGDTFLNIHNPEDVRSVLANDGATPIIPGFDNFIQLRRNHQADHFGETTGLMAQGEEWYRFRKAVQQDMMRPKSALYYIKDIETVAVEFTDKVLAGRDKKGEIDIGTPCKEFSLDAISLIFLGGKIGALAGSEDADELIQRMDFFMKYGFFLYMCPTKLVQWLPFYKQVVTNSNKTVDLLVKHIEKAKESIDTEDESVLAKLIEKHGRDSKIPLVMAMDALGAGIDTTGNSAALLLYNLATNQDKQELLHQEIISILGKDGSLSSSSLAKMRYLKACQQESTRLLPITSGIIRETQVSFFDLLTLYSVPRL